MLVLNQTLTQAESQCVNKLVLCCVNAVVDGSEAEESWQYIVSRQEQVPSQVPARSEVVSAEGVMCSMCGRNFR